MGSNFYWKMNWPELPKMPEAYTPAGAIILPQQPEWKIEDVHIGKRSWIGAPHTYTFCWALDPDMVMDVMAEYIRNGDNTAVVQGEYGDDISAWYFVNLLKECKKWEMHLIGKEFC